MKGVETDITCEEIKLDKVRSPLVSNAHAQRIMGNGDDIIIIIVVIIPPYDFKQLSSWYCRE
jgi:hypothetical protein